MEPDQLLCVDFEGLVVVELCKLILCQKISIVRTVDRLGNSEDAVRHR